MSRNLLRLHAGAAAVVLAISLSACGSGDQQSEASTSPQNEALSGNASKPSLSPLSPSQDLRDKVARSESAIASRGLGLAELASECPECAEILTQVSAQASKQEAAAGGLWNPWPGATARQLEDELPMPAEVTDAPPYPGKLAGYMFGTAWAQAKQLSQTTWESPDQARTLGYILANRLYMSHKLAQFYSVDPSAEASSLSEAALSASLLAQQSGSEDNPQSFDLSTEQSGDPVEQSGDLPAPSGDEDFQSGLNPLLEYDCVATTLGFTQLMAEDPERASQISAELRGRSIDILAQGTNDSRSYRCVLEDKSLANLSALVVQSDIALMVSSNTELQKLGLEYLKRDIGFWISFGDLLALPEPQPIDNAMSGQEGQSDEQSQ